MTFDVRWPDGERTRGYSPSLVIREHLSVGAAYPVTEFRRRALEALAVASDRVERRFGYPCSRARAQAAEIDARCARFADADEPVVIEGFATSEWRAGLL